MKLKKELIDNINKIHTTELGVERIRRNLDLKTDNVVEYCIELIKKENNKVKKNGKNYYITYKDIELTINASSFTVITAHRK